MSRPCRPLRTPCGAARDARHGGDLEYGYFGINLEALNNNLDKIFVGIDASHIPIGGITGFPVLFISGAESDYIQTKDHLLIRSIFPVAEVVTIPGAGHWVHAEQPALLVKTIKYFLEN